MRPLGHRRQLILFLAAILVPSALLVGLSLRSIAQERELVEKRRQDDRRRRLDEVQRELLARLEAIEREQLRAPGAPVPGVALVAAIDDRRLVLPWEGGASREALRQAPLDRKLREAERAEFAARDLEGAAAGYAEAEAAARNPAQSAYARLLRARVLDKLGRHDEALRLYRGLLALPPAITDEDGLPLKLYAAERLLDAAADAGPVLEALRSALIAQPWPAPVGCFMLSTLAERLTRAVPEGPPREEARRLQDSVAAQIRVIAQAEALQGEFLRLPRGTPGGPPVWALYGEEPWLVRIAAPAGQPARLLAVRAREVTAPLQAGGAVRFLDAHEPGGDSLGARFPGLRADILATGEPARGGRLLSGVYAAALLLVVSATGFGAYLIWRDLRRDVQTADLRAQFVSSISHELKTPLTSIRMYAETLQMGRQRDPGLQQEYLDTIVNECERLSRLVDDVLQFSRIEQGKKVYRFRPTRLAETLRAAARALDYQLQQRGFDLRLRIQEELTAPADDDSLQQALLNLLSNAMKYSGDGRDIELALARDHGEAVIRVTDHGVGIAPEEQARIFEKFYRAQTRENQLIPGTGLGLALVAQIVKAHGGRVEVESAPGKGSTFSIRLPLEAHA